MFLVRPETDGSAVCLTETMGLIIESGKYASVRTHLLFYQATRMIKQSPQTKDSLFTIPFGNLKQVLVAMSSTRGNMEIWSSTFYIWSSIRHLEKSIRLKINCS